MMRDVDGPSDDRPENRLPYEIVRRVVGLRLTFVREGVIVQGRTRSFYEKQLVQHAIMKAFATSVVSNEIEVAGAEAGSVR